MNFNELNLSQALLRAVDELGYTEMTEIQQQSIPLLLEGRDVVGRSNTGTGKTAAFGIPAVESITDADRKSAVVLILCPTRELAMQANEEIRKFAKFKEGVRTSAVYGGGTEIVTTMLAISCLSLLVPIVYLHKKLKMPFKVEFMSTVNDSAEILSSIGMAMVVCTIVCLPSAYSSSTRDIYNYFRTIDTDISIWDQKEFVIYTIFEIVVLSILNEILLRGGIFGALRQFGDSFAITVTAVVSALLTRDFYEMPAAILISIVASVGMLRSGTIITAFFVRIIYKIYLFTLIIFEVDTSSNMMINRNLFMLIVFISGVAVAMSIQVLGKRKRKKVYAPYQSENPAISRFAFAMRRSLFFSIAGICLLQALIDVVL